MFALSQPDKKEIPLTNLESWICLDFISNLVLKFLEHFFPVKLTFICLHQLCIDYLASATVLTYDILYAATNLFRASSLKAVMESPSHFSYDGHDYFPLFS